MMGEKMKKNNPVVKNIISAILNQVIVFIYGFLIPIIIIKKFGSEVNGLISSIAQFLAYISLLEGGIGPVIKNSLFKPLVDKNTDELGKILGASDHFFKKLSFIFIIYIVISEPRRHGADGAESPPCPGRQRCRTCRDPCLCPRGPDGRRS